MVWFGVAGLLVMVVCTLLGSVLAPVGIVVFGWLLGKDMWLRLRGVT